jgi:hypothetical protein
MATTQTFVPLSYLTQDKPLVVRPPSVELVLFAAIQSIDMEGGRLTDLAEWAKQHLYAPATVERAYQHLLRWGLLMLDSEVPEPDVWDSVYGCPNPWALLSEWGDDRPESIELVLYASLQHGHMTASDACTSLAAQFGYDEAEAERAWDNLQRWGLIAHPDPRDLFERWGHAEAVFRGGVCPDDAVDLAEVGHE